MPTGLPSDFIDSSATPSDGFIIEHHNDGNSEEFWAVHHATRRGPFHLFRGALASEHASEAEAMEAVTRSMAEKVAP